MKDCMITNGPSSSLGFNSLVQFPAKDTTISRS